MIKPIPDAANVSDCIVIKEVAFIVLDVVGKELISVLDTAVGKLSSE